MQGMIELKLYLECDVDKDEKDEIINDIYKSNILISQIEEVK